MDRSFLMQNQIFGQLKPENLDFIAQYLHYQDFEKTEVILKQGQSNDRLFIVVRGEVEVISRYPGDQLVKLGKIKAGSCFGEVSLMESTSTTATVTARKKTSCAIFERKYLQFLQIAKPEAAYDLAKAIALLEAERIRGLVNHFSKIHTSRKQYKKALDKKDYPLLRDKDIRIYRKIPKEYSVERIHHLGGFQLFSLDELEELLVYAKYLQIDKCSKLNPAVNQLKLVYSILSGAIQISYENKTIRAKLDVLGPGRAFNMMSLIDKKQPAFDFLIRESSLLLGFEYQDINAWQKKSAQLFYKYYYFCCMSLVASLRSINRQILRIHCEFEESEGCLHLE